MTLLGNMYTGVSGMAAQTSRLSAISDNIANADTTGYKRASVSFSSMVALPQYGSYGSGGVESRSRRAVSEQGDLSATTSSTDLSISGAGFFIVQNAAGIPILTRDGSFDKDDSGNLVNSTGNTLMGYSYAGGEPVLGTGYAGLVPVNFNQTKLAVAASTKGTLDVNLPSTATSVDGGATNLPPVSNSADSAFSKKISVSAKDGSGNEIQADFYLTKIADDTWNVTAFVGKNGATMGFPYDLSGGDITMSSATLAVNPTTGAPSGSQLSLSLPGGGSLPLKLDGSGTFFGASVDISFPADATVVEPEVAGATPAKNQPESKYSEKSALIAYDNLGNAVQLDMYYTKLDNGVWEAAAFNHADASSGGFPYGAAGSQPLATAYLYFNPQTGKALGGTEMTVGIPNGESLSIDFSQSTQLAADFSTLSADIDGYGATSPVGYDISADGIVSLKYADGTVSPQYRIPLANVISPDSLTSIGDNAYVANLYSGDVDLGWSNQQSLGEIKSGSLEGSNVDLATELTEAITSQRAFTANSKAYQTSAELWETVNSLKR